MRNLLIILSVACGLTSCNLVKRSTVSTTAPKPANPQPPKPNTPVFIENISIKPEKKQNVQVAANSEQIDVPELGYSIPSLSPEAISSLQFKYAILLDVPVEYLYDVKLLGFLESWYGTRYRMGGIDKTGIDCSAFAQQFMMNMFDISLPRTSGEQFLNSERVSKTELKEGDLVFFHTQRKKQISHVGVYLRNNKFIHASTSSGVMISDLNDSYFRGRFVGAGRYTSITVGTH